MIPSRKPPRPGSRFAALCAHIRAVCGEPESQALALGELARRAGLSPFHFQRLFKAEVGVTPRQYAEACRLETFKKRVRAAGPQVQAPVTEALHEAGFGSSSRLYEKTPGRLGMTPTEYRRGGEAVTISYAPMPTPLGLLLVAATDRGLCSIRFGASREWGAMVRALRSEFPAARIEKMAPPASPQFQLWIDALAAFLREGGPSPVLPIDVRATAFQFRVWSHLQTIPAGTVQSYAEVARALGRPTAARAVANACASNRVALVIPCHRVIRGDGGLGGFRWGLERKRALLALERRRA